MKRVLSIGVAIAGTFFIALPAANAIDEVIQKGKQNSPKGQITEVKRESVTVKPQIGNPTVVPANEIVAINWEGAPPDLKLARSYEQNGSIKEALAKYLEVQAAIGSAGDNLKADVTYVIARTTAKLALLDPTKLDDAIKKLEEFNSANPDSYHHFEAMDYLGQIYLAKEDFDKAKIALDELAKAPWSDFKMAAQSANARLLMKQGDVVAAAAAFDEVIKAKATSPLEESRRFEAMLGKSRCLIQQQKYEDALTELDTVVSGAAAEDTKLQAEAYVRQGDCFQSLGRTKEAVLAYLHIDVLFPREKALHAESLYHLARLWGAVGQAGRGAEARAKLEKEYPANEWTQKLAEG